MNRRFDGVDMLRGISILAVILLHISIRMSGAGLSFRSQLPAPLYHLLFRNGNNGVTVFFAISGFLITWTSLRRFSGLTKMDVGRFYRLRFARIAPMLLLVLAALSLLHLVNASGFEIQHQRATLPRALTAALTFHLNWLEADRGYLPAGWDILWSLSVEEMFYLFFPLICVLLFGLRHGQRYLVALLAAFIVAGPFARSLWAGNEIWQEKSYLGGMDAIATGCLCALMIQHIRPRLLWAAGVAGAVMLLLVAVWPNWPMMKLAGRSGLDGTLLALGTCLVISATVLKGFTGGVLSSPLRWLGRHSYEVYLTHEFIVIWGVQWYVHVHRGNQTLWVIAIAVACVCPGAILAKWFSEPLNARLRSKSPVANLWPAIS